MKYKNKYSLTSSMCIYIYGYLCVYLFIWLFDNKNNTRPLWLLCGVEAGKVMGGCFNKPNEA